MNHNPQKGLFITLEGIEGAGKSTAMLFIQQWLSHQDIPYKTTREPGGTVISERIRQLLLAHHEEAMSPDAELLLMFASRAQHLFQFIIPHLNHGNWVISDRFTDASYAYQGGGRGVDTSRIEQIEHWVQKDLKPDQIILLDIPVELALLRIQKRKHTDRIEQEKSIFFERARQAYLARAHQDPERYTIIDATKALTKVCSQIGLLLTTLWQKWTQ